MGATTTRRARPHGGWARYSAVSARRIWLHGSDDHHAGAARAGPLAAGGTMEPTTQTGRDRVAAYAEPPTKRSRQHGDRLSREASREVHPASDPHPSSGQIQLIARLLAPYLSVIVFWCLLHNAWLALLGYHAQALAWLFVSRPALNGGSLRTRWSLLAAPAALAGPVLYFLLPYITRTDLTGWLAGYGLHGITLVAMVPYFGLVHPLVEQAHWTPLRERTPISHVAFAGYHLLVLWTLLGVPWLAAVFAVLLTASVLWSRATKSAGGVLAAYASHALADLGIVVAALIHSGAA